MGPDEEQRRPSAKSSNGSTVTVRVPLRVLSAVGRACIVQLMGFVNQVSVVMLANAAYKSSCGTFVFDAARGAPTSAHLLCIAASFASSRSVTLHTAPEPE